MDLLDLIIDENGDLELKPGSDFNRENFGHMTDMPTDSFLVEILESFLCNGWEWISGSDKATLGYLTGAPVLANDCIRNDDGEITWIGNTYWHERYAIEDPAEMLLDGKSVIFQAA